MLVADPMDLPGPRAQQNKFPFIYFFTALTITFKFHFHDSNGKTDCCKKSLANCF